MKRGGFSCYNANFSSGNYNEFYMDLAIEFERWFNEMDCREDIIFYKIYILKYPLRMQYPSSTDRISCFITRLNLFYKSRRHWPKLEWIRECSPIGQYYHLLFQADDRITPQRLDKLKKVTEIWQECLGVKEGQGLVQLITTVDKRCGSSTDVKLFEDEGSFPSRFTAMIRLARRCAECNDLSKLPVDFMHF